MATNSVVLTTENYSQHTNELKCIRKRSHILIFKYIIIKVLSFMLNINQTILKYFTHIKKLFYLRYFTYY